MTNLTMQKLSISTQTASDAVVKPKSEKDRLKEMFPALCRPNEAPKVGDYVWA